MRIRTRNVISYLFLLTVLGAYPLSLFAAVILENPLNTTDIRVLINKIIDLLFTLGIPLAVLLILWAGFLFLTSGGDPQKVNQAKATLLWTIIGFSILLLSKGIIFAICDFFGATGC